jgi:rhodanese-related sulfurtransferase
MRSWWIIGTTVPGPGGLDTRCGGADDLDMAPPSGRRTLDHLMADAETRIERLSPLTAARALDEGALLIDIRSQDDRLRDGIIPGSLHVPRTVLEWRLDPDSPWRSPHVGGLDRRILLLCDHGYSSVLAAATLAELGFEQAGDVVGGFRAWREAGLPVAPAPPRRAGELAGMGPPEPA